MALEYSRVVAAWDMSTLTPNGRLRDFGPSGIHMAFGAGAAAPVPQLDASMLFSGAQFFYAEAAAQARFYANAPTGAHTWLILCQGVSTGTIFSCWTAALRGLLVLQLSQLMRFYQGQGVTTFVATTASSVTDTRRSRILASIETTPNVLINGTRNAATWGLGGLGTTLYDTGVAPRIGMYPDGSYPFTGRLYYLCLMRGALHSDDLRDASRLMAEGIKPFCWRAAA